MLDLTKEYKVKREIVLRTINNNYWALNTSNGNQYKLNEISYFIINQMIENATTIEQIAQKVVSEYKVSLDEFVEDCKLMIQVALENQIVEEVRL